MGSRGKEIARITLENSSCIFLSYVELPWDDDGEPSTERQAVLRLDLVDILVNRYDKVACLF